ncbi:DsbE family thiol:disulfide interchange protein [Thiohalomonas denitrificans]|uniref:DsbE family thiol:disulfide interchange protein n=1 Tax=Thiohalomonas denitrificans TaxID=415747 RepID=UPI0026EC6A13|nr:DsbE family thiol:disulfide interchange protein [Thiohalomonas denitrificans]
MKTRFLAPLMIFGAMVGLFYFALMQIGQGDYNPRDIPSPLINQAAPAFDLPAVTSDGSVSSAVFAQHQVSLFNVWASWCVACRQEHPFLMDLARRGEVPIYGLNYKDERADAIQWLNRHGDPYVTSGFDLRGDVGIDWGVYGVPETFVIDGNGMVRYKHVGPLGPESWEKKMKPVIDRLKAESS